ncbi:MAG: replication-associated recombination protein A, partial [Eggerthellaceae bacterium]|nr:replication-associated recombination protein A [Eggerthellaceae bacterium]
MSTIFEEINSNSAISYIPLAVRIRPQKPEELIGHEKALGNSSWLKKAISSDSVPSIILYGPAGTGKTTIAKTIANTTSAEFKEVSAVSAKVSDIRNAISKAKGSLYSLGKKTILFIDEIHRFSKSQQDTLLHAVENRTVILIATTTENPYFEINSALISRCRIVHLDLLYDEDIKKVIQRALKHPKGLKKKFELENSALDAIARVSNGDARMALTTLELASGVCEYEAQQEKFRPPFRIKLEHVREVSQNDVMPYDKNKDIHYDIISAFIKSMRGSDPDAALYWLARMIDGGEDPKFIARRIMILASEDIGNADPQALLVAQAVFKATEVIGYP